MIGCLPRPVDSRLCLWALLAIVRGRAGAVSPAVAILHVGPHKTGTTTLQSTLLRTPSPIADDGFDVYLNLPGRWPLLTHSNHANLAFFLRSNKPSNPTWKTFLHDVNITRTSSRSIYWSAEGLSVAGIDWGRLVDALSGFQIRAIVGYRPYHSWLVSVWTENRHKQRHFQMPPLVDWLRPRIRDIPRNAPISVFERLKNMSLPVRLHTPGSMTDGTLVMEHICDMIGAPVACARMKERAGRVSTLRKENVARSEPEMDWIDDVVHVGLVRGLWKLEDVDAARSAVRRAAAAKGTMPRKCLDSEDVRRLSYVTWEHENTLYPDGKARHVEAIMAGVQQYSRQGRLCSADYDQVLVDSNVKFWRTLL